MAKLNPRIYTLEPADGYKLHAKSKIWEAVLKLFTLPAVRKIQLTVFLRATGMRFFLVESLFNFKLVSLERTY